MAWWKENVFLQLLIAFVVGILLAEYIDNKWVFICLAPALQLALMQFLPTKTIRAKIRVNRISSVLVHLSLIAAGILTTKFTDECNHPTHYCSFTNASHYVAVVDEPPAEKTKVIRVKARLSQAIENNISTKVFGETYLYMRKSEQSHALQYGDVILIENTLKETEPDPNPHAIDYRFILHNKQIYRTGFLNQHQWTCLPYTERNDVFAFAYKLRDKILTIINKYIGGNEAPVAASLLMGYRDAMDFELENAYAAAGVVHILAVSGMHVGLIFMLFNSILQLSWFRFIPTILKKVLMLSFIWFFAMLTGFSGSVVRACAMLTVYIIGLGNNRHTSPLNLLFASTFALLVWSPRLVFDVGFELSFFAVLGIMIFQRPIYEAIGTHNPALDWGLKMVSISAAAQISTLPLILFYFHQFPLHFLWANLLVVPFSSILIYSLLALLVMSVWSPAATLVGFLISNGIDLMNRFVFFIGDLPFSVYHLHHFGLLRAVGVAVLIGLMYAFIYTRRIFYLQLSLTTFAALLAIATYHTFRDSRAFNITAFKHPHQPVVSIRNGYEAVLIRSKSADFKTGAFDRYLEQYYEREGVRQVKQVYYEDSSSTVNPFPWLRTQHNVFYMNDNALMVRRNGITWINADAQPLLNSFQQTPFILTYPNRP